jgi:hypothetical protein
MLKKYSASNGVSVLVKNIKLSFMLLSLGFVFFVLTGGGYLLSVGKLTQDYFLVFITMLLSKTLIILLGVFGNYFLAVNREIVWAKIYLLILFSLSCFLYLFAENLNEMLLPIFSVLINASVCYLVFKQLNKNKHE